jgi:hypothetical protein
MQPTLNDLTSRVLFDEKLAQRFFPRVPVAYISATRANWHCVWGYIEAKRNYERLLAEGKKVRPTSFYLVEGGNHFVRGSAYILCAAIYVTQVHWDRPKELVKIMAAGIRG